MENNHPVLSRRFSPAFLDKDSSLQLQILSSGVKVNDETAKFNSASRYHSHAESAIKITDANEYSKDFKAASDRKTLEELSENRYYDNEDKENKPSARNENSTIDLEPVEENQAIQNLSDNNTSFSAHNHSGMLLPIPIPKKKRKSANEDKERTTLDLGPSQRPSFTQSRKNNESDWQNSTSISFLRNSHKEDDRGFRDYNRKFHGKPFKERIEYLGTTIEDTIRENVQENLRIVKDKLLQQPRSSHDMVITLDGFPTSGREENHSSSQQQHIHHHHYYHQTNKSVDLSSNSQNNLYALSEGQSGYLNQRDSAKPEQQEVVHYMSVAQTQTEGLAENVLTRDWHQSKFQFESYLMEKVQEIRKFSCAEEKSSMPQIKEVPPTLGNATSVSEPNHSHRNATLQGKEEAQDTKTTYCLTGMSSQSQWKSKNNLLTLDSVFCGTSNRQDLLESNPRGNFERETLRASQHKLSESNEGNQNLTIKPQSRSTSTQKRESFVIRNTVSTEKSVEALNSKKSTYNSRPQRFLIQQTYSTRDQSNGYNSRHSHLFTEEHEQSDNVKFESKRFHTKQASVDGIDALSIGMNGRDFNPFEYLLNHKARNSSTNTQDPNGGHVDHVDFSRVRHPSISTNLRANRGLNIPKSKSFSDNSMRPTVNGPHVSKRNSSVSKSREILIVREDEIGKQELVQQELKCVELINKKHFDEALKSLFSLQHAGSLPQHNPHSLYLNYLIAECYAKKNLDSEALSYSERALNVIFDSYDYQEDKFVYLYAYALLNLVGTISIKQHNFERAVQVFNQIEDLVSKNSVYTKEVELERLQMEDELHIIYFNRANALMGLNEHQRAHDDYQKAQDLLSQKQDKISRRRHVMCLKKFAVCKHKLALHHDALSLLQAAIQELLENESMEQDLKLLASIYDQAAALYTFLGKTREMIKYYNTSLQIKIDVYGMNDEQTALAFLAAGKAFLENKEFEKALYKFQAGNEVLEKINGRYTIHSANCYVCMAQMRYKMKHYLQAVDLYEIALEIYMHLLGPDHLYTYRICLNLLYLAFVLKDTTRISFFENKLVRTLGDQMTHHAFVIFNEIGNIFRKNQKFKQALKYYFHSINIFEYLEKKEGHYEGLSLIYCNIASTHLLKKDYHESIKNYKIALRILDSIKASSIERRAQINANLGKVFRSLKHVKDAKYFLMEAERLYIQANAKQARIEAIQKLLSTL